MRSGSAKVNGLARKLDINMKFKSLKIEFKSLTMMELRSSPGEILDRVARDGEAFIVERNGQQKACLVPISYFLPDIPPNRISKEWGQLLKKGEDPQITITDLKEIQFTFTETMTGDTFSINIVLPHGYPNTAPKVNVSPLAENTPHRWQDGSLEIFGVMANWDAGIHDVVYVLDLSRQWLKKYSQWKKTG